ncbi:MAG: hypothetical protein KJ634_11860 [Gammaproteobacteria bacterium]|nr:hypothetical protein [Gammaproteobacteria bacterium]MBU1416311.1 hypothetical protein [Gammaproteobacteria bacterium]
MCGADTACNAESRGQPCCFACEVAIAAAGFLVFAAVATVFVTRSNLILIE